MKNLFLTVSLAVLLCNVQAIAPPVVKCLCPLVATIVPTPIPGICSPSILPPENPLIGTPLTAIPPVTMPPLSQQPPFNLSDVSFTLATRKFPRPVPLNGNNLRNVKNKKTLINIAGWAQPTTGPQSYFPNITKEYLKKEDYNVILVHADKLMRMLEIESIKYVELIAQTVAEMLILLCTETRLYCHNMHIIGHGLGAHIAGLVGLYIYRKKNVKIDRVTGLEPSRLGFEFAPPDKRLDKMDAKIVDVYHTAADWLGLNMSLGTIDFWINGGKAPQPGCYSLYTSGNDSFSTGYCRFGLSICYYIYTIRSLPLGERCSRNASLKAVPTPIPIICLPSIPPPPNSSIGTPPTTSPSIGTPPTANSSIGIPPTASPSIGTLPTATPSVTIPSSLSSPPNNLSDVLFTLATRTSPRPVPLNENNLEIVTNKESKINIAGWAQRTTGPQSYFPNITAEYLKKGDYNVILVHADKLMNMSETESIQNVEPIVETVAEMLILLRNQDRLYFYNMHIIGHGLGAHIAGLVGLYIYKKMNVQINRVTALEVSRVGFEFAPPDKRLDKMDARVVDVYHTAAGSLGINMSLGTIDFWIYGGTAPQPGCLSLQTSQNDSFSADYCSFEKSIWYYVYTIRSAIYGVRCSSYASFKAGLCDRNDQAYFGDRYGSVYSGNFYLNLTCSNQKCVSNVKPLRKR
ncbi:hypothetical protein ILUMI_08233 [Ignelater luminosus]|uniref:Lipase domain-containing protein n=1 Tax=Ignelater luminosus TaxID=2038154 RepID=A0A8K0D7Y6_IGNLU|nr:hypothetical protein ILUMI_08233 [Ignelater luminosus]